MSPWCLGEQVQLMGVQGLGGQGVSLVFGGAGTACEGNQGAGRTWGAPGDLEEQVQLEGEQEAGRTGGAPVALWEQVQLVGEQVLRAQEVPLEI